MKFPPYITEIVKKIKPRTKTPGSYWNVIHKALKTYYNMVRWDEEGWRFYAIKEGEKEIEVGSLVNWSFAKWDEEDEENRITGKELKKEEKKKSK